MQRNEKISEFPKVPLMLNGISPRFLKENLVIPLELKGNRLVIVTADPDNREVISALQYATGDRKSVV